MTYKDLLLVVWWFIEARGEKEKRLSFGKTL
jgi:hypothetical protein